jgi:hypothetical protein
MVLESQKSQQHQSMKTLKKGTKRRGKMGKDVLLDEIPLL